MMAVDRIGRDANLQPIPPNVLLSLDLNLNETLQTEVHVFSNGA